MFCSGNYTFTNFQHKIKVSMILHMLTSNLFSRSMLILIIFAATIFKKIANSVLKGYRLCNPSFMRHLYHTHCL